MSQPARDALVGSTLADRYRLDELIARGGMALVYKGRDLRLGREVAVKVLHPHLSEVFGTAFVNEARHAAHINHPNVVTVHDAGETEQTAYLVMEFVDGYCLRDLIRTHGRLTAEQACAVLAPVAAGLAAAHRGSVVHGDVKPENILISLDGLVKIADFGLARAAQTGAQGHTLDGSLLGTPAYMSPEYIEGGERTSAGDIYALGIVAYELVAGLPPFRHGNAMQIALAHSRTSVPAPSTEVPGLDQRYDRFVIAMTEANPAGRLVDVADHIKALRQDLPAPEALPRPRRAEAISSASTSGRDENHPTVATLTPTSVLPAATRGEGSKRGKAKRRVKPGRIVRWSAAFLVVSALGFGFAVTHRPVPTVAGLTAASASAALTSHGFSSITVAEQFDNAVPYGHVISAMPHGSAFIWQRMSLTVSRGPRPITVLNVAGHEAKQATTMLIDSGFVTVLTQQDFSENVAAGLAIRTEPGAGTAVNAKKTITVIVSRGPRPVPVPEIRGVKEITARTRIAAAGLKATVIRDNSDSVPSGRVIAVRPDVGTEVPRGSAVQIVVSKGPVLVAVPDVYKLKEVTALARLRAVGLVVDIRRPFGTPYGRVVRQDVSAGTKVRRGSTIVITVV